VISELLCVKPILR